MKIKYISELNSGELDVKGINFWQAIAISFLYSLIFMIISTPTDLFFQITSTFNMWQSDMNYYISLILSFIYQYGTILIVILLINRNLKLSRETLSTFKVKKIDYILASMLIVAYIAITYGWFDYILFSIPSTMSESIGEYLESLPIIVLLVESCIIAPIFEEIFHRGILLGGLMKKYNAKKAVIYSALIFGIAHMNLPQGINAFFLGLILGVVYYYTKSIYICIAMHFTNNLLVNFVFYPQTKLWTVILFIGVPIIGIIIMTICWRLLNLKVRSKEQLESKLDIR